MRGNWHFNWIILLKRSCWNRCKEGTCFGLHTDRPDMYNMRKVFDTIFLLQGGLFTNNKTGGGVRSDRGEDSSIFMRVIMRDTIWSWLWNDINLIYVILSPTQSLTFLLFIKIQFKLKINIMHFVCVDVVCLYACKNIYYCTYYRSRIWFWQDLEESVVKRHVAKVERFQLGHGGEGLSTQHGCLRAESKPDQSQFLDLWKNVYWAIFKRRVHTVKQLYTPTLSCYYFMIFLLWSPTSHWLHVVHNQVHMSAPDRAVHYFQSLAQNINEVGHAYGQFRTRKSGNFHVLFTHDANIK